MIYIYCYFRARIALFARRISRSTGSQLRRRRRRLLLLALLVVAAVVRLPQFFLFFFSFNPFTRASNILIYSFGRIDALYCIILGCLQGNLGGMHYHVRMHVCECTHACCAPEMMKNELQFMRCRHNRVSKSNADSIQFVMWMLWNKNQKRQQHQCIDWAYFFFYIIYFIIYYTYIARNIHNAHTQIHIPHSQRNQISREFAYERLHTIFVRERKELIQNNIHRSLFRNAKLSFCHEPFSLSAERHGRVLVLLL